MMRGQAQDMEMEVNGQIYISAEKSSCSSKNNWVLFLYSVAPLRALISLMPREPKYLGGPADND
jgi:hypothetical protein